MNGRRVTLLLGLWLLAIVLAGCSAAATSAPAPAPTVGQAAETEIVQVTQAVEVSEPSQGASATGLPSATDGAAAEFTREPTLAPATGLPPATPTVALEARVVELEWPARMRLGDSDGVRLSLIPSTDGYTITTEFPDNTTLTQTVTVARVAGYELYGVARLDGVGFEVAPAAEQLLPLPQGDAATWRWTLTPRDSGQHRLIVDLRLRWVPAGAGGLGREAQIYSRTLTVEVTSFLGLTARQAMWMGMFGLTVGSGLSVMALFVRTRPRPRAPAPNTALAVEPPAGLALSAEERTLLQTLFRRYSRLMIESEFRSGYSGARTLLALPVRDDGRSDAHTIVKLGERRAIEREHHNYEVYVKDTLPPMTARIQDAPVSLASAPLAALRYTFIAEPGQRPASLREALLRDPDAALLTRLFDTFGPSWWMQRRAHAFRLAQEYDRVLPAHVVLEPAGDRAASVTLEARVAPSGLGLKVGDVVRVGRFAEVEVRLDGKSLSLNGEPQPGEPPLRARWLNLRPPDGATARVAATREMLLRDLVAGCDLLGLPDPLVRVPGLLRETVAGSRSTIHGDLNLENVLVGPGGFVWLIDFAQTRDGHPPFDFAHLEAEIIAHILAPQLKPAAAFLKFWGEAASARPPASSLHALVSTLHGLAARCLVDAAQPREYHLALCLACLGALKHANLDLHQRHCLYLAAAHLARDL
jgi:hypothetical protein